MHNTVITVQVWYWKLTDSKAGIISQPEIPRAMEHRTAPEGQALISGLEPGDWHAFAANGATGRASAGRAEKWSGNENASTETAGALPGLDISGKSQRAIEVLSSIGSSAQQKFQVLEDLAKAGGKSLDFVDLDGTERHLSLEYQKFESRALIHVFTEEDGKTRTVLRAVCDPDGSYSLERDSKGLPISFYGSWWTSHEVGRSYFAPLGDGSTDLPPDSPELNALFDRAARSGSGRPNRMEKLRNGTVFFLSKMDIDADGSPRAKELDPKDGSIHTSLRYPDGGSVNAETMPYFVLPGGKYQHFHVSKGDIGAVRYRGKVAFAVFADVGPARKLGEGSMELASELNIPNSPIDGGIKSPDVEYLVFPGSGDHTPGTQAGNAKKGLADLRKYAGK